MLGFRNSNERNRFIKHFEHVICNFLTEEVTVFPIDDAYSTPQIRQIFVLIVTEHKLAEHGIVELPGPAICNLLERMTADLVEYIAIVAVLGWHQAEPGMGCVKFFIDSLGFDR